MCFNENFRLLKTIYVHLVCYLNILQNSRCNDKDVTECSETSAYKIPTPGNYPEESTQHS